MADNVTVAVQGTAIAYGNVGASPATALGSGNIDEINGFPQLTADEYDKTRINQGDLIKQFAGSLVDPGLLSLKIGFDKAQANTVYGLLNTMKAWKITFLDTSTLTFNGFVKKIGPAGSKGDEVVFDIDIRVSGGHTFTPAA